MGLYLLVLAFSGIGLGVSSFTLSCSQNLNWYYQCDSFPQQSSWGSFDKPPPLLVTSEPLLPSSLVALKLLLPLSFVALKSFLPSSPVMLALLVPLGTATLALLIPLSPVSLALLIPPSLVVFMLLLINALLLGFVTFYPGFCRWYFSYNHHLHCISPAATHLSFQPFLPKRTPGTPQLHPYRPRTGSASGWPNLRLHTIALVGSVLAANILRTAITNPSHPQPSSLSSL